MKPARKYQWDEGFYLARSDPERIAKPKIQPTPVEFPESKLEVQQAIRIWRDLGVFSNDSESIRRSWEEIQRWQKKGGSNAR